MGRPPNLPSGRQIGAQGRSEGAVPDPFGERDLDLWPRSMG